MYRRLCPIKWCKSVALDVWSGCPGGQQRRFCHRVPRADVDAGCGEIALSDLPLVMLLCQGHPDVGPDRRVDGQDVHPSVWHEISLFLKSRWSSQQICCHCATGTAVKAMAGGPARSACPASSLCAHVVHTWRPAWSAEDHPHHGRHPRLGMERGFGEQGCHAVGAAKPP